MRAKNLHTLDETIKYRFFFHVVKPILGTSMFAKQCLDFVPFVATAANKPLVQFIGLNISRHCARSIS